MDDQRLVAALEEAHEQHEPQDELHGLFAFYAALVRAIAAHKEGIELTVSSLYRPDEANELAKASRPHLRFEDLPLEPDPFRRWLERVAEIFESRDPGAIEELEPLDAESALEEARLWYEQGISEAGPTIDALLLNAMAPYLESAAELLLPKLPLHFWNASYCPVCGGYPDFSLFDPKGNEHELLCERCRARWAVNYKGCLICGEQDPAQRGFYTTEDNLYRVEVCDTCGGYLKMANLQEARKLYVEPQPEIERLLTPGLDLIAAQEGYGRPALFDHGDLMGDTE